MYFTHWKWQNIRKNIFIYLKAVFKGTLHANIPIVDSQWYP